MSEKNKGIFAKIKSAYVECQKDCEVPYRIVEFIKKDNIPMVAIGQRYSHYYRIVPLTEAADDDKILAGLSPRDVQNLSMYTLFLELQRRYELDTVEYHQSDEKYFNLKDKKTDSFIQLTTEDILNNPDIFNKIKDGDQFKVGYLCGDKNKSEDKSKDKDKSNNKKMH